MSYVAAKAQPATESLGDRDMNLAGQMQLIWTPDQSCTVQGPPWQGTLPVHLLTPDATQSPHVASSHLRLFCELDVLHSTSL